MNRKLFLLLSGIFLTISVHAIDFWEMTNKAREWYLSHDKFQLNVKVLEYNQDLNKKTNEAHGVMKLNGSSYYSKIYGKEILVNGNNLLVVDEVNKSIIVNTNYSGLNIRQDFFKSMMSTDDYFEREYSKHVISENKDEITFRIISKSDSNVYSEICFLKTGQVKKVTTYSGDGLQTAKEKTEIIYYECNFNPDFSDSEFSCENYVDINGRLTKGAGNFKDYQIINITQNKGL